MEEINYSHMIYSTNQIAFRRKIVLTIDIVQIRIVKRKARKCQYCYGFCQIKEYLSLILIWDFINLHVKNRTWKGEWNNQFMEVKG